mmetsp:Transcript_115697/g.201369  ORF Transcript_115697/g.201369 Transcript_115697/m.201369 type:complete len:127 (+) Transcript_115697:157-537(+)
MSGWVGEWAQPLGCACWSLTTHPLHIQRGLHTSCAQKTQRIFTAHSKKMATHMCEEAKRFYPCSWVLKRKMHDAMCLITFVLILWGNKVKVRGELAVKGQRKRNTLDFMWANNWVSLDVAQINRIR